MRTGSITGLAVLGLALAACGTDPAERTGGGAAAGAATGAVVGALGGPVGALAGAAIGAGAGAVTGAATSPQDVNLGRPVWDNPEVRTPVDRQHRAAWRGGGSSAQTREAQDALARRGFDPGAPDGVWGPQTSRALTDFQRQNNLAATGRLDSATMRALDLRTAARRDDNGAYMGGGMVGSTPRGTTSPDTGSSTGGAMPRSGTPPMMNDPSEQPTTGRSGP